MNGVHLSSILPIGDFPHHTVPLWISWGSRPRFRGVEVLNYLGETEEMLAQQSHSEEGSGIGRL